VRQMRSEWGVRNICIRGTDMLNTVLTVTCWLLVAVLSAWGVHHLWSKMLKPRTVNSILLPEP